VPVDNVHIFDGFRLSNKLLMFCLSSGVSTYDTVELDEAVVVVVVDDDDDDDDDLILDCAEYGEILGTGVVS
jgi:hypothetical protein